VAVTVRGVRSEYGRLRQVLLYRPGPEIGGHPEPATIQHLVAIDHAALMREFDAVVAAYERLGIKVELIDSTPLSDDREYRWNMMYCRDLCFMTPHGAILANMANTTRREEPRYAARMLRQLGIPVLHTVCGEGHFEGADALWLSNDAVMIGVGNRTDREGFSQIAAVLEPHGISCHAVPSHQTRTQHLLGSVQLVDRDLALVRSDITDPEADALLNRFGYTVVAVPEHPEVTSRQAMNIITVAPRSVVMTARCPVTRDLYLCAGLEIADELEIGQFINGAGGLACATGILARTAL
jgi:N-dimethylarginine dimethylaminohydrolase